MHFFPAFGSSLPFVVEFRARASMKPRADPVARALPASSANISVRILDLTFSRWFPAPANLVAQPAISRAVMPHLIVATVAGVETTPRGGTASSWCCRWPGDKQVASRVCGVEPSRVLCGGSFRTCATRKRSLVCACDVRSPRTFDKLHPSPTGQKLVVRRFLMLMYSCVTRNATADDLVQRSPASAPSRAHVLVRVHDFAQPAILQGSSPARGQDGI